jgi:lipopolysaccharide/colanic/teichoic acid biosynthesis glycosyltransferase
MVIKDGMNAVERFIKRLFDFACSFVGLLVLSPVFLIVYISLRLQNDGSVIFKQERIGYKGKPFNIYKFRTMRTDSESNGKPQLAVKGDERLTKVGKFLREHHLDELPQLYNVFVGDMSFVGPRPERQYFIDKIKEVNPNYDYLFLVRPGVTSMATIYNGYTDTIEKMLTRLQMDLDYLQKRSLFYDLKIIVTTVLYIIKGKKF